MPKNIVDAYKKALNKLERADFQNVVSFCENDEECREDTSLKKNVLIFIREGLLALLVKMGPLWQGD